MALTLVTAYLEIPHNAKKPNTNAYLNYFRFIATLDYPLVVFIQAKYSIKVKEILNNSKRTQPFKVISKELNQLYLYKYYDQLKQSQCHSNPISSTTPEYAIITISKSFLMQEIAELNPFKTQNFAWIDFGIYHGLNLFTQNRKDPIKAFAQNIKNKLVFNLMNIKSKAEVLNRSTYYKTNFGLVSAQMMAGNKAELIKFNQKLDQEIQASLKVGYYGLDEQYWGALVSQAPNDYDYVFGDYGSPLSNADILRIHHSTINLCFKSAYDRNLYRLNYLIIKKMLKTSQYMRIDKNMFVDMLNRAYITVYYYDIEYSKYLADVIIFLYSHGLKAEFSKIGGLNSNLGCIGKKLSDKVEIESLKHYLGLVQFMY